jgi:hypothetical protein
LTVTALNSPTARLKPEIKTGKRYSHKLGGGLSLIYRRGKDGTASWSVGMADGKSGQVLEAIGMTDDLLPADNERVFSFDQARDRAIAVQRERKIGPKVVAKEPPQTIDQALASYGERLLVQGKKTSTADWLRGLFKRFGPELLERSLAEVTADEFQTWQGSMLADGKAETTINKAIGQLKPAFKWAARDPRIANNADAWETGFTRYKGAKVKIARKIRLTDDQVRAAVAHAYRTSQQWGLFVQMHAEFGTRTSQLARVTVDQLQGDRLEIPGDKKGNGSRNPRSFRVRLSLLEKLRSAAAGQPPGAILLRDENGDPWLRELPGKNEMVGERHYTLWSKLASELEFPTEVRRGKLCETTLYALRSASIARLIKAGRPIKEIADIHFTSVAEIEQHYHRDVAHDDTALAFDSVYGAPGAGKTHDLTEANIVHLPVGKAA